MTEEEKILPDPVEISGIRIGDNRFKIKTGLNTLDLNRKEGSSIGYGSVARSPETEIYDKNFNNWIDGYAEASGVGSYSLGVGAAAKGRYSFAFGTGACAIGEGSFCFRGGGELDSMSIVNHGFTRGSYSAAFNRGATFGEYSFAEGSGQTGRNPYPDDADFGQYAHAEGHETIAEGNHSHAEGNSTISKGKDSHAEGSGTQAIGENSHAEGLKTQAIGAGSHAGGEDSISYSALGFAHGFMCITGIKNATQEEERHIHSNTAIGQYTTSSGLASIASGSNSQASGDFSLSHGDHTSATEKCQVTIGRYNKTKANRAFIIGNGTYENIEGGITTRSNALEVDWDGNLYISGSLFSQGKELSIPEERLLPEVSENDNNKILSVVNGKWAAISVVNSEGVAY